MTTTEHLSFSVLTAPLATIDRRGLSQAWYSALYARENPAPESPLATARTGASDGAKRSPAKGIARSGEGARNGLPGCERLSSVPQIAAQCERRSVRSPLARKIERTVARKRKTASAATFALEGAKGRVQLLLRTSGTNVRLIAICPESAREHVGVALAHARYALAARGIALDARTRGASC